MTYLYPVGRGKKLVSRSQLSRMVGFARLHPEVQRRALALMRFAQDEGVFLSFSGGWRDGTYAESEFYRRYTRTEATRRPAKTAKKFAGAWWTLNPGEIGCATPWNGWHTWERPGSSQTHDPVAIDWYGNLKWMQANCGRVGFRSFQHIPGEGHHTQPVEYPGSRSDWRGEHLSEWPLPELPPDPPVVVDKTTAKRTIRRRTSEYDLVRYLQTVLGVTVDGDFGWQTDRAVRTFQKLHNLKVDGIVGPKTWAEVDRIAP